MKQELLGEFFEIMIKVRRTLDFSTTSLNEGATPLQIQTLKYLEENSGSTAGELAAELRMSPSAVTQLTDRLIDSNLISREYDKKDRRVVYIRLTQIGKKYLHKSLNLVKKNMGQLLDPMPETDLKEIIRIFGNLLKRSN